MEIQRPRCAGIDVHKKSITVCVLIREPGRKEQKFIREFATSTSALLNCADWLKELAVPCLAMESTGVYWKPLWNLLEGQFEMLLVNATQSNTCRDGRPISATVNGLRNYCNMVCSNRALFHPPPSATCAI